MRDRDAGRQTDRWRSGRRQSGKLHIRRGRHGGEERSGLLRRHGGGKRQISAGPRCIKMRKAGGGGGGDRGEVIGGTYATAAAAVRHV